MTRQEPDRHIVCERCNGSGEIAVWCATLRYCAPGPVPDYAEHVTGVRCDECRGTGIEAELYPVECDDDLSEREAA